MSFWGSALISYRKMQVGNLLKVTFVLCSLIIILWGRVTGVCVGLWKGMGIFCGSSLSPLVS